MKTLRVLALLVASLFVALPAAAGDRIILMDSGSGESATYTGDKTITGALTVNTGPIVLPTKFTVSAAGALDAVGPATFTAGEATDASLVLIADDGDDVADKWTIRSDAATNMLKFKNGATDVFSVGPLGQTTAGNNITAPTVFADTFNAFTGGTTAVEMKGNARSSAGRNIILSNTEFSATSGSQVPVAITPTYNQASGTTANIALEIAAIEIALGSGAQKLISAKAGAAGTTERFSVSNVGIVTAGGGSASAGVCWKADGITLGYCSGGLGAVCGTCN